MFSLKFKGSIMKAKGKISMLVNVYADNNSIINLMKILDTDLNIAKQCTLDIKFKHQSRYHYYLQKEIYESAIHLKSKIKRLESLLKEIDNHKLLRPL